MRFQNNTQMYVHPGARGRRTGRRGGLALFLSEAVSFAATAVELFKETAALKRCGRVLLVVVPVTIICNLICISLISSTEAEMVMQSAQYRTLESNNISLLATKARAWRQPNMAKLAKRVELYPPVKGQSWIFDRYSGRFRSTPR